MRRIMTPFIPSADFMMKHHQTIVYGAIMSLFLAIFIAAFLFLQSEKTRVNAEYPTLTFDEKLAYWERRVRDAGGIAAYQELGRTIENFSTVSQHDEAHIFGDALFRAEGLRGIASCDGRFLYGCFHSFAIRGIQELGSDSAQTLHSTCIDVLAETAGECQHGVGHGILGLMSDNYDYSPDDLTKALAACDALVPATPYCMGGVFMEYNLRSMNRGAADPRQLTAKNALNPCLNVPKKDLPWCGFWLPKWWVSADPERDNRVRLAKAMGMRCESLSKDREPVEACIRGIGNTMHILTDQKPADTAIICNKVTADPGYRYACHEQSALRFLYYFPASSSLHACDGLPEIDMNRCKEEAVGQTQKRRFDMGS